MKLLWALWAVEVNACQVSVTLHEKGESQVTIAPWQVRAAVTGPLNVQNFVKGNHHCSESKQTCQSHQGQLSVCWECVGLEDQHGIETMWHSH